MKPSTPSAIKHDTAVLLSTLAAVPLFAGYDRDELTRLAATVRLRRFRRGEVVFHRGDPGSTLFVVATGRVKIVAPTEAGESALLAVMGPGDFFGELSLLDGDPRSATAIALEPLELWTLHRDEVLGPLLAVPAAAALLRVLAMRIRRCDTLVEEVSYLDLSTRLARALLRLAEDHGEPGPGGITITLSLTQSDLAAMIGGSRPRVNVLLGQYQNEGFLRFAGRAIVLSDLQALRAYAGDGEWSAPLAC